MIGYNGQPESIVLKQPDIPTYVGQVVTLFNSATMLGVGQLRQMNATLLELTCEILSNDSAANGLNAYTSSDGGTTFTANLMRDSNGTATMPITITASDAPRTYSFVLTPYREFKLTYTVGVTPTTWAWHIVLHTNSTAVQR